MHVVDDEELTVELIHRAELAFCSGTAVIVPSVKLIGHETDPDMVLTCKSLNLEEEVKIILTDIQCGRSDAPQWWLARVTPLRLRSQKTSGSPASSP
mmetsp:Transcript_41993/g.164540  ORF Transcript_41993/g.164540 Transcript_41993/m.164540 type:complete len:97 (+) Transcript_41993:1020-1310(+)|eukprot:CAMPEP_0113964782 /NCGR_PEP_ID=MMETSP0011_2-20120614/7353_1 /TAXON_ID=101924 /ORGANISM="Rhodosorus marinus" /LENGTH=96 /DNA_ID=CAMNT_0000977167 /DNA_START=913 /DNA_END=1203 /DNA_ORIENTATION=- /assembly_acc=CAM_ASM_000156